jgi:hypothetical protein
MNAARSRVKRALNMSNGDDAPEVLDLNTQAERTSRASVNMSNGDDGPEVVDLNTQAERTSRASVNVRQLSPTQRAGMHLAIGVGLLIALVTLLEVASYVFYGPVIPLELPEDPETAKAMIENHKVISEIYMAQALKVFEVVILGGLLPIFTAILGYIFGTQTVPPSDER